MRFFNWRNNWRTIHVNESVCAIWHKLTLRSSKNLSRKTAEHKLNTQLHCCNVLHRYNVHDIFYHIRDRRTPTCHASLVNISSHKYRDPKLKTRANQKRGWRHEGKRCEYSRFLWESDQVLRVDLEQLISRLKTSIRCRAATRNHRLDVDASVLLTFTLKTGNTKI